MQQKDNREELAVVWVWPFAWVKMRVGGGGGGVTLKVAWFVFFSVNFFSLIYFRDFSFLNRGVFYVINSEWMV